MSRRADERRIAQALAESEANLAPLEHEKLQYIVGPVDFLTPFCGLLIRKSADEYKIDYDSGLLVWEETNRTIEAFPKQLEAGNVLWKHNVYPRGFLPSTLTKDKLPQAPLIDRVRGFLTEHSKSQAEASDFLRNGNTEFLMTCRRLKPADLKEFSQRA